MIEWNSSVCVYFNITYMPYHRLTCCTERKFKDSQVSVYVEDTPSRQLSALTEHSMRYY